MRLLGIHRITIKPLVVFHRQDWSFFAVLDGHAGKLAAAVTAKGLPGAVADAIGPVVHSLKAVEVALKRAILDFDVRMEQNFAVLRDGSGTTCAAVLIGPASVHFVNLGDSRVVESRSGHVVFETTDHKPGNPDETARVIAAGGNVIDGRVDGGLAVSRALGDYEYKMRRDLPRARQKVMAVPDVTTVLRVTGRRLSTIVLGCDGVWDARSSAETSVSLHEFFADSGGTSPEIVGRASSALVASCLESHDNVSAIVILSGTPAPQEVSPVPGDVGRRCRVHGDKLGTVCYVGPRTGPGADGTRLPSPDGGVPDTSMVCGVELDRPDGLNDGGALFSCKPRHGILCRPSDVSLIPDAADVNPDLAAAVGSAVAAYAVAAGTSIAAGIVRSRLLARRATARAPRAAPGSVRARPVRRGPRPNPAAPGSAGRPTSTPTIVSGPIESPMTSELMDKAAVGSSLAVGAPGTPAETAAPTSSLGEPSRCPTPADAADCPAPVQAQDEAATQSACTGKPDGSLASYVAAIVPPLVEQPQDQRGPSVGHVAPPEIAAGALGSGDCNVGEDEFHRTRLINNGAFDENADLHLSTSGVSPTELAHMSAAEKEELAATLRTAPSRVFRRRYNRAPLP